MGYFDEATGKLVVRVVFDGAALSGKTTNVRAIQNLFSGKCVGERESPDELFERTRYLDWLRVDTGLVEGHKLSVQFVTVPGQRVLHRRRRFLLTLADAIVFVASAEPERLPETRRAFSFLQKVRADLPRDVTLLVQLNKCDVDGAVNEETLRSALGIPDDVRVLLAEADRALGVRDTMIHSIRAAADRIQDQVLLAGIDGIPRGNSNASTIREEIDRLEARDDRSLLDVILDATPLSMRPAPANESTPPGSSESQFPPTTPSPGTGTRDTRPPELPRPDEEPSAVWPANRGREFLNRALLSHPARVAGTGDQIIFESDLYRLETSPELSFTDEGRARDVLVLLSRAFLSLDRHAPRRAALVLTGGAGTTFTLWRILPRLGSLAELLEHETRAADSGATRSLLGAFESALRAVDLALGRLGSYCDPNPANFVLEGEVVYMGPVRLGKREPNLVRATRTFLEGLLEASALPIPASLDAYLERAMQESSERLCEGAS